ncbi:hypothetical protein QTN23_17615 [Pseudomonas shirazica]|uniref:hypothetical protein n=1 Tax=Pseudomonas shirazica TaxID=1940636 RepID=UPI0025A93734|nr:hypothetical protein [Pseudomonas shirazica]MDM9601338.1 hypothetical protein [Pseudomonas shirazica]MDO2414724.1 hypothetical protein [Pseudomonas shirazica]
MQSADYVPGVSGWKIDHGLIEMNGGPHGPIRIGNLDEPEQKPSEEQLAAFCLTRHDLAVQFLVVDGITYINEAFVRAAAFEISDPKIKVTVTAGGNSVAAGLGMGLSQERLDTDQIFIRRVQEAAQRGAQEGYRMVLDELKRSR